MKFRNPEMLIREWEREREEALLVAKSGQKKENGH